MNQHTRLIVKKLFLIFFFISFAVAFVAIGLYRYYLGQIFYYDFGIFAHIIWQLSRFQAPYINHVALGNIIFLGDHFNPGLALFAPFFWITHDLRILLIEQSIVIVVSGFLVYKIARIAKLRYIPGLACSFAYMLFAGTENPLVTDWHPEPTAALFLLLFFYLFIKENGNKLLTYIILLLFLSLKESNSISLLFILPWLLMIRKERWREVSIIGVFAIAYFFLTTKLLIPHFSNHGYIYSPTLPTSFQQAIQNVVNKKEKIILIRDSLYSFGGLPVLSLGIVPVVLELSIRLLPTSTIFNNLTLGQHYNVLLGVFLGLSTIYAIKNITTLLTKKQIVKDNTYIIQIVLSILLVFSATYTARKITGSPINLAINKTFWSELRPNKSFHATLESILKNGSVMSQNNILPYVSNRSKNIYTPKRDYDKYKPDIIVFDLTQDQNPNNFYPSNREEIEYIIQDLQKDTTYKRKQLENDNVFIFEKVFYANKL